MTSKHLLPTIAAVTAVSCSLLSAGNSLLDDIKKNGDKPIQIAPKEILAKHSKESKIVARDQDELAADVQDLIQDQTDKKVINLLEEAELLMGEATELLEDKKTDGNTIAVETEIIEKIYEAAKQKKKSQPQSGEGEKDPMLQRMEEMMGKEPGDEPGKEGEGNSPGQGSEGDSDKANDNKTGTAENTKEERTVPKNTTAPSNTLPREEQRALDAYKRATSNK